MDLWRWLSLPAVRQRTDGVRVWCWRGDSLVPIWVAQWDPADDTEAWDGSGDGPESALADLWRTLLADPPQGLADTLAEGE